MRFELIPEFRNDKPYPTATSEIGYERTWMGVANGTDAEMLAAAKQQCPEGRAFEVDRSRSIILGKGWGDKTVVTYEKPYSRWFVELVTIEELLAVIEAMSGDVSVQGNVIKEYVE